MILKITTLVDEDNYRSGLKLESFDDEVPEESMDSLRFLDGGEPEDNSLGRDWSDVHHIRALVETAYNAGKAGEELTIEEVTEELDTF